jgi:hypothetical protein
MGFNVAFKDLPVIINSGTGKISDFNAGIIGAFVDQFPAQGLNRGQVVWSTPAPGDIIYQLPDLFSNTSAFGVFQATGT